MFHFESISPPPHIPEKQWTHWKWQMQNSLKTPEDFEKKLQLSKEDKKALEKSKNTFAMKTTPYSIQLCQKYSALRQITLPHLKELDLSGFYQDDPSWRNKTQPCTKNYSSLPRPCLIFSHRFLRHLLPVLHSKIFYGSGKPHSFPSRLPKSSPIYSK